MSPTKTLAVSGRVLRQLRHDPRTLGLILLVPCLLLFLLRYVFWEQHQMLAATAPMLLGIFPLFMMFLVTSITTLRERTTGTLDRLLSMPVSKLDIMAGYAIAFSLVGLAQASLASVVTLGLLDVAIQGSVLAVLLTATAAAFLGTALGLFVSAFAKTEFQAVELVMPILLPQLLLCGLFVARDHMVNWLQWISNVLPLSYSVDAMKQVATEAEWTGELTRDLLVVLGFACAALVLGALTIRRTQ